VTERLVNAASSVLARRTSRRGLLARVALVASAASVGPLRYFLRPQSAEAVITCSDCGGGAACCDGWTTFCCTLIGTNTCPAYTFIGGWWKCTDYRGSGLCHSEGVRYYIDCNRLPGRHCPHGCSCTNGKCHNRATCCNVFRYGQCNTQVKQVTEVVCRVVSCVNPCRLYPDKCSCTEMISNATCSHQADCLNVVPPPPSPPYTGLGSGGGRL
jgi:hypothetical protein